MQNAMQVMIVNIGPVQNFIATARRTRDLWYSSWLLSELAKAAAAAVLQQGGDLVFPAVDQAEAKQLAPGGELNVVNRIVALVNSNPGEIGRAIEANLAEVLSAQWKAAREDVAGPLYDEQEALAQVLDLVECVWAAAPYHGENGYSADRTLADLLLAARKATRDFAPVSWGDMRPKSSLDGQRESMIPEDRFPALGDDDAAAKRKVGALYRLYGAGRAERLSAVDLLKRHGNKGQAERTPSTSHIAARPFVARLKQDRMRTEPLVRRLIDDLNAAGLKPPKPYSAGDGLLGYDGSLLYETRLRDEAEEQELPDEQIEQAVAALARFYNNLPLDPGTGRRRYTRPSPYYALLVADGDNMGRVVDAQTTPEAHRAVSRKLAAFAARAREIVADHAGFPIYAGGDDVLALTPLHTLLDCAEALHSAFAGAVGMYRSASDEAGTTVAPTLSIGIVIAHHLEPLTDVLTLARQAEKTAKGLPEKDALAITLSKRGGADRTVVGRWPDGIVVRLRFLMARIVGEIPDTAAHELLDMERKLTPLYVIRGEDKKLRAEEERKARLPEVKFLEAQRILSRKRGGRGILPMDTIRLGQLSDHLRQAGDITEFANELILARLLADAHRLASGEGYADARAPEKEKAQ